MCTYARASIHSFTIKYVQQKARNVSNGSPNIFSVIAWCGYLISYASYFIHILQTHKTATTTTTTATYIMIMIKVVVVLSGRLANNPLTRPLFVTLTPDNAEQGSYSLSTTLMS